MEKIMYKFMFVKIGWKRRIFFCVWCDVCVNQILSLLWVWHTWMSGTDLLQTPEFDFEGHTSGPYLLPCLMVEWAGLQEILWCLVCFSTGALDWYLYVNLFFHMAVQPAVACSEVTDCGLLVSWQLMECVLVWVVSSSLAVEDGFLFIMDRSFGFSIRQIWLGLLLFGRGMFGNWVTMLPSIIDKCMTFYCELCWSDWGAVI